MTTTDYSKLTDREIDALVAERFMGWTNVGISTDENCTEYMEGDGLDALTGITKRMDVVNYSTDDNAARVVRNRIAELGLKTQYAIELSNIVMVFEGSNRHQLRFEFQHATPRQQCEAALAVLGK